MPQSKQPATIKRLTQLARQPSLVIEGGVRPLGVWFREGGETLQPFVAIWVDAATGYVRASRLISPKETTDAGRSQALDVLVEAMHSPNQPLSGRTPQRGRPAKVVVDDPELAAAARSLLAPADVPVELAAHLPRFEDAYAALSDAMDADLSQGPPEPFTWDIAERVLPPLYQAAARCARQAPWELLPDFPPVAIDLGEYGPAPGVERVYASVLGGAGVMTGVACYFSMEDLEAMMNAGQAAMADDDMVDEAIAFMRQLGAPLDDLPPEAVRELVRDMLPPGTVPGSNPADLIRDSLICFYETPDEVDPTYVEWIQARGLKLANQLMIPAFHRVTTGTLEARPLNEREAVAFTLVLGGLARFTSRFLDELEVMEGPEPLIFRPHVEGPDGKVRITLRYPPEGQDWPELEWPDADSFGLDLFPPPPE